jgi:hypothetical protein
MFLNEMVFLIRHTPFWAIPMLVVSIEFAYLNWLKKKKMYSQVCGLFGAVALCFIVYYYWAGGPERAVRKFMRAYYHNVIHVE